MVPGRPLAQPVLASAACSQCRPFAKLQVVPALAIHDTMKHIGSDVATVGFGACLGMTGFLMAVGKKVGSFGFRGAPLS